MKIAMGFLMAGLSAFLVYGFFVFGAPQTLWYTLFFLLAGLIVSSATVSFWLALATFIEVRPSAALGFVPDFSITSLTKSVFSVILIFLCISMFIPGVVSCYLEIIHSDYSLSHDDYKKIVDLIFGTYWLPYLCAYVTSVGLAGVAMAADAFPKKRDGGSQERRGPPGHCHID